MNPAYIIAFSLGISAVFQATLNRKISSAIPLSTTVLINALLVLVFASIFLFISQNKSNPSEILQKAQLWWMIPGAIGFSIIAGLPWAVSKVGALPVFVLMVTGQMLTSLLWDYWVNQIDFSIARVSGVILAILGAFLTTFR